MTPTGRRLILSDRKIRYAYFAELILYSGLRFSYNMDTAGAAKLPASGKEVVSVSTRERILTIRLMEKMNANPAYAEAFGIAAQNGPAEPKGQTVSDPANNQL